MKHLLTILCTAICFSVSLPSFAQTISEGEAMANARKVLDRSFSRQNVGTRSVQARSSSELKLAYTAKKGLETYYYVFNIGNDEGFIIAGGDAVAHEILAYVPQGHFDYEALPSNVKWWLGEYEKEISSAKKFAPQKQQETMTTRAAQSEGTSSVHDLFTDIPDMITTKWNQLYPYNNSIPEELATPYLTGCFPTAVAQIMKYWNYPERGIGSHTDSQHDSFSVDFSQMNYDWENMLDTYDGEFNQQQADAVGTLMYHIGVACDAIYTETWTGKCLWFADSSIMGENFGQFLVDYFGYDSKIQNLCRANYNGTEWKTIIYDELYAGRPVLYSGDVRSGEGYDGHSFICHGYSSEFDMFAFNWGWGGYCDGYYFLDSADGILANDSQQQEELQSIIIGIMPPKNDSSSVLRFGDTFEVDNNTYQVISPIQKTVSFVSTSNSDDNIEIPDYVRFGGENFCVNRIESFAFQGKAISSITLPNTLSTIAYRAFEGCTLESIIIPEGTIQINSYAFSGCSFFRDIDFPSSILKIGSCLFQDCM